MQKKAFWHRLFSMAVIALVSLGAFIPTQLLVVCVGADGHVGIELAHDGMVCPEVEDHSYAVQEHTCCAQEDNSDGVELSSRDICCELSGCHDTQFPVQVASVQGKTTQTNVKTLYALALPSKCLQEGLLSKLAFAPDSRPAVSPHISVSVLRL
jgi:hypothetical protein